MTDDGLRKMSLINPEDMHREWTLTIEQNGGGGNMEKGKGKIIQGKVEEWER